MISVSHLKTKFQDFLKNEISVWDSPKVKQSYFRKLKEGWTEDNFDHEKIFPMTTLNKIYNIWT